jgi:hypothetical protein
VRTNIVMVECTCKYRYAHSASRRGVALRDIVTVCEWEKVKIVYYLNDIRILGKRYV